MIFALAGNQNCGKTTLFNALTGSNQHVGNFPGVTVDQKVGEIRGVKNCQLVDLPGIYSLRPYTQEEVVTRDFILNHHPDGIINIVDATNIERNLYLTLQLLELRVPMVLALNMMDEVRANGGTINIRKMSEALGIPVVPIAAAKGEGVSELLDQAVAAARARAVPEKADLCPWDSPVHRCIHAVTHLIQDHADRLGLPARFCTTKLIEGGGDLAEVLELDRNERELLEHCIVEMEAETGLDRNAALADMRYTFIEKVVATSVVKCRESREHRRSMAIDRVLTGKYTALPVFLGVMGLVFYLTFGVIGAALSDWLSLLIDAVTALADAGLTAYGINPVVHSLIIDGVFAGVGGVLSFLPIIVVLFFFLSILEDTGYMARVAFVMDRPLRKIGLSGRSFVPMLIGFGCSVPAIMATRTVSSDRDRKMTILLTPYMSCSAKIPIYAVFAAAFFPGRSAPVMIGLYLTGILLGVVVAAVLKSTRFRGQPVPFVMELPNYRLPSAGSVALLLWEKARDFLERAFTIIFLATIIIWFLQTFDVRFNVVSDSADSMLALVGRWLAPVFAPLGFGDWRMVTALISGFTAKEAVVSTLTVLLGTGAAQLETALTALFTPLSAVSFLVFTLLYTPCVAAVATIRRELNSTLATLGVVAMQCGVAWLAALAVYRVGLMLL
ncbi:ferrous iron transport protein B [Dysosmobacter sp.]|uniref:ferrous iron transport protein B n=1 Tax=Dysosmobacter sp. TaxID=2591382 RepID=UPI002A859773|nr:ferrous iron transport protein B [Dysosmobacter sp.]MDY3282338.1 ferrous iron transport protein B [Dysosmobacter sp.]